MFSSPRCSLALAAVVCLFTSACKDEKNATPPPSASKKVDRQQVNESVREESVDARVVNEPAKEVDAAPLPASLAKLERVAELVCSCTTPSCVDRFIAQVEDAKKAVTAGQQSSHASLYADLEERIDECAKDAAADGLGDEEPADASVDGPPVAP